MRKPASISRVFQSLVAFAAISVLLALVLVAGALIYVTTESGESLVHDLAVSSIESAGLGRLELEELHITFPPEIRARRLVVSENGRPWLSIEGFHLQPGLAALTAGNLLFERLAADRLELHPPPVLAESAEEEESSWLRAIMINALVIEEIFLGAELLSLEGSSLVGPLTLQADGAYRFEAGSFSVEADLGFSKLQGDGSDGAAWELGRGRVGLDLEGRVPLVAGAIEAELGRVELAEAVVSNANVAVTLSSASRRGLEVSIESGADPSGLPGDVAFLFGARTALKAQAQLSTEDFSIREAEARFDGGAGVTADLTAEADPQRAGTLAGQVSIDGVDVSWPEAFASVVALLGRDFSISSDFEFEPDQRIALSELALDFGPISAGGAVALGLDDDAVDAELDAAWADLGLLSDLIGRESEGRLDVDLTVSGSLQAMEVGATARTDGLSIERTALGIAEVELQATGLPQGPTVVNFSTGLGSEDLMIHAEGRIEDTESQAPMFNMALWDDPGNTVDLSGELIGDRLLPNGSLVADVKTLTSVVELFGLDVAGRIVADVRNDDRGISGTAAVTGLHLPGITEIRTLEVRSAEDQPNAVEIAIEDIHFSGTVLDAAQLTLRRNDERWLARIALQDVQGAIDLTADLEVSDAALSGESAGAASEQGALLGRVVNIGGQAGGREVTMLEPLVATSASDGNSRVQGRLGVGEGHMSVDWTVSTRASFGEIHAERFPLRYITPFIDETLWLDGSLGAEIVVPHHFDREKDAVPTIKLAVLGMRTADTTEVGQFAGVDVHLSAEQLANEVSFDATIGGRGRKGLVVDGSVATTAGDIPFAGISGDSILRAKFSGLLEEPSVIELAALADARLLGRLLADLSLGGTVADPTLQGSVDLLEGRYEDAATGAILRDLDLRIIAENTDIARLTLTGNDGERGSIEGSGEFDLSAGVLSPTARASVVLRRMRAARLDDLQVLLSGDLEIRASQDAVSISGQLTTDELTVELPERLPAEVVELPVVEENVELLDRPKRSSELRPPGPTAELDVVVEVPGPAFVRSKEVKTDWRGRIIIGGTTAAISLDGGLDLIRGDFTALGVQVIATEGKIRLDPSPDARHTVDIRGRIRRQSVTVTVIVAGEADNLSVRLRSEPPMPEDEILAFVLFGSNVSSLTPTQAVQLAVAVASLASPRRAADPLAWVRDTTGLDRISIRERQRESDDEDENRSDYMLSAGKYVREGVFVSVDQPLGQGASEVSVELEVTERLTLKSSVGADATGNVGAAWTLDY